jgi:thiol-disulfide isomerase/thioredoxin
MRRRELVAGLAGLATVGTAAWASQQQLGQNRQPGTGSDGGPSNERTATGVSPVTLETVAAPGSEAGTVAVPARGTVTFVSFFATWCHVCESEMPALAAAHTNVGGGVQFVSVTNEPVGHSVSREDVADWWREHDGNWPVALDADLELTEALSVAGVPRLFVIDADNQVAWTGKGRVPAETIEREIADAGRDTTD